MKTDIARIEGIPEIPYAVPVFGHLLQLGSDHSSAFSKLQRQYKSSIFQVRLGRTRAVVVNSFDDCRRMYITHQSSVIDRPVPHTIKVVAATKGLTIGTSPWNESTKKRRKVAGTVLSRSKLRNHSAMFDLESFCVVRDLGGMDGLGAEDVGIRDVIQRFALNSTLSLCYGIRMDAKYDDMVREILDVGHTISRLRGTAENIQDYVPLMRYFPNNAKDRLSKSLRNRRDQYLDGLLEIAKDRFARGIESDCVYSSVLKDQETILTKDEVSTVCLSLVSGGFETIPGTLISCIGSLSTEAGLELQEEALKDIMRHYSSVSEAWSECVNESKVPFVNAIVKEALRYYTVLPMGQPRKTVREIQWGKATIPAETTILFNTTAANHDEAHFGESAYQFDPTRWLDPASPVPRELESTGIQHFGFGGGSRMCPGIAPAQRMIYAVLVRLITSYRFVASKERPPNTHYSEFNTTKTALVAVPADFCISLRPRDSVKLATLLCESEARIPSSF